MATSGGSRRVARLKARSQAKSDAHATIAQKALGDSRVSTDEQAEHGHSLENQERAAPPSATASRAGSRTPRPAPSRSSWCGSSTGWPRPCGHDRERPHGPLQRPAPLRYGADRHGHGADPVRRPLRQGRAGAQKHRRPYGQREGEGAQRRLRGRRRALRLRTGWRRRPARRPTRGLDHPAHVREMRRTCCRRSHAT